MSDTTFKKKYGPWCMVIGAAEGLGEAYTIALAKRGMNIIMVDNQKPLLDALSKKVEQEYGIETILLQLDLYEADAFEKMSQQIQKVDCRLLVYNAAYSLIKPFIDHTTEELDHFIDINTRTQIKLVHEFSLYLIEKKLSGGLLLMSSLAGLIGMQLVTPYAATKAFTWNLVEALHHELTPYKIDIMACIAGATATPAYLKTNPRYGILKPSVMNPSRVAELTLKKLGKKTLFIPGCSNRMNYFILTRIMPRKIAAYIANRTMGNMYVDKKSTNSVK
jgi:short-subunit dehydrogenase